MNSSVKIPAITGNGRGKHENVFVSTKFAPKIFLNAFCSFFQANSRWIK